MIRMHCFNHQLKLPILLHKLKQSLTDYWQHAGHARSWCTTSGSQLWGTSTFERHSCDSSRKQWTIKVVILITRTVWTHGYCRRDSWLAWLDNLTKCLWLLLLCSGDCFIAIRNLLKLKLPCFTDQFSLAKSRLLMVWCI